MDNAVWNLRRIQKIHDISEDYIRFVSGCGNECAWTDSIISDIKKLTNEIIEFNLE